MTIRDIEAELPWGFHDAYLERLEIDWMRRAVTADIRVMMSERQDFDRRGRLSVSGLAFVVIDPPVQAGDWEDGIWIDSDEISTTGSVDVPTVPSGYFLHRFFAHSMGASIFICARGATFDWLESAPSSARAPSRALFPGDSTV